MSRKTAAMDQRASRTRYALARSLMTLGAARGLDALTVRELSRHAGVGRSTFYGHYRDKADFLATSFAEMLTACEAAAAERADRAGVLPAREVFQHVHGAAGFARVVQASRDLHRMMAAGEARLRLIAEANLQARFPAMPGDDRRAAAAFLAGGFQGLLRWWMHTGMQQPPERLARAYFGREASVLGHWTHCGVDA